MMGVPATGLFAISDAAWHKAAKRDTETNVGISIIPQLGRYSRRY
jgi:hypothetical protein